MFRKDSAYILVTRALLPPLVSSPDNPPSGLFASTICNIPPAGSDISHGHANTLDSNKNPNIFDICTQARNVLTSH